MKSSRKRSRHGGSSWSKSRRKNEEGEEMDPNEPTTGHLDSIADSSRRLCLVKLPAFLFNYFEEMRDKCAPGTKVGVLRVPTGVDTDEEEEAAPSSTKPEVKNEIKKQPQTLIPKEEQVLFNTGINPATLGNSNNLLQVKKESNVNKNKEGEPVKKKKKYEICLNDPPKGVTAKYELDFVPEIPVLEIFSNNPEDDVGNITYEGRVASQCVARPNLDASYRAINRARIESAIKRGRETALMDEKTLMNAQINELRQFSGRDFTRERAERKLAKQNRRTAVDKPDKEWREKIMKDIFELFEQTPYWSMKDLVEVLDGSQAQLKPVVDEICFYNKRGPNINLYELKDEYKTTQQRQDKRDNLDTWRKDKINEINKKFEQLEERRKQLEEEK